MFKETYEPLQEVEVIGKIKDKEEILTVDCGATKNFINKDFVDYLNIPILEDKTITTVFGNGEKVKINKIVNIQIKFNNELKTSSKFYIIENSPVKIILGNQFLDENECNIDFKTRILYIKKHMIKFNNFITSENYIDDILIDKLSIHNNNLSTKLKEKLLQYLAKNESFNQMNISPVTLKTSKYLPNIKNKTYNKYETNGYFITITDIFSRKSEVYFYKRVKAEHVIKSLKLWIEKYKKPCSLISDNGKQYTSNKLKLYLNSKNIKQIKVPVYSPNSNGISERINNTISEILMIHENYDIKRITQKILHRLNENYNRNVKSSPNAIVYGKNFYDPLRRVISYDPPMVRNSELGLTTKYFDKNKFVYLKNISRNKLDKRYYGPFKILEVGKKNRWVKVDGINEWIHIKNIKPWRGKSVE